MAKTKNMNLFPLSKEKQKVEKRQKRNVPNPQERNFISNVSLSLLYNKRKKENLVLYNFPPQNTGKQKYSADRINYTLIYLYNSMREAGGKVNFTCSGASDYLVKLPSELSSVPTKDLQGKKLKVLSFTD